ncbi:retinoic acid receptor responder protein 2 [Sceloporus undulatus]|uniref:retinoic acid receptor responder protein 2 n=1 Tax=Sceloporus undulatus TaxID=8520 RepID=UPI001C4CA161|nr:retinoic acid receptor responder protein 2 [Sceloporus undulatus]
MASCCCSQTSFGILGIRVVCPDQGEKRSGHVRWSGKEEEEDGGRKKDPGRQDLALILSLSPRIVRSNRQRGQRAEREPPLGHLRAWTQVNDRPRSTSTEGSPHAPVTGKQIHLGHRRMKALLVLCLGLLALVQANRSPVQQKALDIVLEYFHGRSFVQSVFKEQTVTEVAKEESPTGTFVHLEVELAQTHCRKHHRRTQNCSVKPGGETKRRHARTAKKSRTPMDSTCRANLPFPRLP